jgi:ribose transport system substrate-binding protein
MIAVIPRTTALVLWEAEHAGAQAAATREGLTLYWNAPTREDDVQRQIAIMDQAMSRGAKGLILAPDQALALMVPVREIVARGVPTVIISSPLTISPGGKLSYILNDEEATGRMAADRIGDIVGGSGTVAVLGVDPDISGIIDRTQAFEQRLAAAFPGVRVVDERTVGFNIAEAQEISEEVLDHHPQVDAILALNSAATRGVYIALQQRGLLRKVKLVACEQELIPPLETGELDSILVENTYEMGSRAVAAIAAQLRGEPSVPLVKIKPKLVTRENLHSQEVQQMLTMDWSASQ